MKKVLCAITALLTLVSCSDYEGQEVLPADRAEGPGLFSGETGEFEIPLGSTETSQSGREKLRS